MRRRIGAGEAQEEPFQFSFDGWLRVDFQGAPVTSGRGLPVVRELDERSGSGELIDRHAATRLLK